MQMIKIQSGPTKMYQREKETAAWTVS